MLPPVPTPAQSTWQQPSGGPAAHHFNSYPATFFPYHYQGHFSHDTHLGPPSMQNWSQPPYDSQQEDVQQPGSLAHPLAQMESLGDQTNDLSHSVSRALSLLQLESWRCHFIRDLDVARIPLTFPAFDCSLLTSQYAGPWRSTSMPSSASSSRYHPYTTTYNSPSTSTDTPGSRDWSPISTFSKSLSPVDHRLSPSKPLSRGTHHSSNPYFARVHEQSKQSGVRRAEETGQTADNLQQTVESLVGVDHFKKLRPGTEELHARLEGRLEAWLEMTYGKHLAELYMTPGGPTLDKGKHSFIPVHISSVVLTLTELGRLPVCLSAEWKSYAKYIAETVRTHSGAMLTIESTVDQVATTISAYRRRKGTLNILIGRDGEEVRNVSFVLYPSPAPNYATASYRLLTYAPRNLCPIVHSLRSQGVGS